jgi:hypothetical protein
LVILPAQLGGLPLTPTGKLDRLALPGLLQRCDEESARNSDRESVLSSISKQGVPESDDLRDSSTLLAVELMVAKVWQKVLKLPQLPDRHSDFLELGGDSLSALRIVSSD